MSTYEWKYTVITIKATLDDAKLTIKQGIRTFEIPVHRMKMLYMGKMPSGNFNELIMVAENESGKQKKYRFYADENDSGMATLVDELVKRQPSIDLRALPRAEALTRMKAADTAKIALYAVPVILLAVMGLFFYPLLIHGLDKGSASTTVDELAAGRLPPTRNVTITGRSLDSALKESKTKKGRTTVRLFFPMVGADWTDGAPIHVLVETPNLSQSELDKVLTQTEQKGIIRNIFWEGPSKDHLKFFREKYNFKMADAVLLLELNADPQQDMNIFLFAFGITVLIVGGVTIFMVKKSFG